MGFSCLACPHRGCYLPFYSAADKQEIGGKKPLNDFLIKAQIRAEQPDYLSLYVIYSPDCCSGSQPWLSLCRGRCWCRRGTRWQRDAVRGHGQGPPARPQTPHRPARKGLDAINIKTRRKTNQTKPKNHTPEKKVLSGIPKKSEAQEQKSPLAPFLGTENGFPEQYHSFDTPVLVSQLPEEENRLKKIPKKPSRRLCLLQCHWRRHQKVHVPQADPRGSPHMCSGC